MPFTTNQQAYLAAEVALWLQRACGEPMEFLGCHNLTGITVPRGDVNPVYCRTGKRTFQVIRTWRGVPGLGSMTIVAHAQVLNLLAELPCPVNLYAHVSACGSDEDPDNYDFSYIFYGVELTSETIDTLSVGMNPDQETPVTLSMPATFQNREKVKKLTVESLDVSALTTHDINDISFCDAPECSDLCGSTSQGCQVGYAVTDGDGGAAVILKTVDGGGVWSAIASPFTTATDDIVAVDCDGDVVVITDGVNTAYAYSLDGGATWNEVLTPTQIMNDVFVLSATRIWFCGQGGYIWFSDDRGASVEVQDAGVATAQSLNKIAFADAQRGYAVGDANAFVRTSDGGDTWTAVTGPSVGNDLTALAVVPNTNTLFVGDEIGNVFRSTDGGDTWATSFAAVAATVGGIADIVVWGCNVPAFAANDLDPYFYGAGVDGVMYRSIDGGATWSGVEVPANDGFNALSQCEINKYWLAGEDALIMKAAGSGI